MRAALHGTADSKIPFEMGQSLYRAMLAPHKQLLLIQGGEHSNSAITQRPLYLQSVQRFADEVGASSMYAAN